MEGTEEKSICTCIQQFLYKSLHKKYKIGSFWTYIPGYELREKCMPCQVTENMDHILTSCTSRPVNIIENWQERDWSIMTNTDLWISTPDLGAKMWTCDKWGIALCWGNHVKMVQSHQSSVWEHIREVLVVGEYTVYPMIMYSGLRAWLSLKA